MVRIIRFVLLLVLLMMPTGLSCAETIGLPDGFHEYSGTINGNLNITLLLERKGEQLEGEYYYDSQRQWLTLRGEMVGPNAFTLQEFESGKNTGVFNGTVLPDGRIEGQWSNPAGSVSYVFQLTKKAPAAWSGKWSRIKYYFSPATLKIWNVSETGFDFTLSAASGANTGRIGYWGEGPQRAQLINGMAVYENRDGTLTFYLRDNQLIIEQKGAMGAGIGVIYLGEYEKGEVVLAPRTFTENKVFRTPAEEEAFKAMVGDAYDTFLRSFHLVYEEKDLDQVDASVFHGGVRGLFTIREGIIMRTPGGEMWAAIIVGNNKVQYFTNSSRISGLPLTIENWRSRFKNREVIRVTTQGTEKSYTASGSTPAIAERGTSIEAFVPEGWRLIKQTAGDLNEDGLDDIAGVIEYGQPYSRDGRIAPQRVLFIALREKDGYRLSVLNDSFIMKADQGGIWGDPFRSVSVDRGSLLIKFYGGSNYRWTYDYRFRYQNDGWYLIGYTRESWYTGTGAGKKEDYNLLTGIEIISTFANEGVIGEETINRGRKELINLKDFSSELRNNLSQYLTQ